MKSYLLLGLATLLAIGAIYQHSSKKIVIYGERLQQIAEEINAMETTWKAEVSKKFFDKDLDTIKGSLGAFLAGGEELEMKEIEEVEAPESFDPRQQWPQCESIKEVRDQANCGSCWAFGAVSAMSDRICVASKQTLQTRISAEDLNSCCNTCGFGCQGGYPSAAWSYAVRTGIVTGHVYKDTKWCKPYSLANCDHHCTGRYGPCPAVGPTPKCVKQCQAGYAKEYSNDLVKFARSYGVPSNEEKIKTELMTNGPAEAAFTVYEDFLSYKSGVYQHKTGSYLGGHAVKIMGWGVEDNVKYWLVANSWNEDWGDKGFFKILRGSNHCGFESQIVAGDAKV